MHPLVVSEVALSLLLLVGAGVTLRSSLALESTDLGFEPTGVMDFWVSPSGTKDPGPDEKRAFYRLVRERVEAVPGIGTVGFTNRFPHQMWSSRHTFDVVAIGNDSPVADVRAVDAGYFQTMRIQLLAGRHFGERDDENAQHVAIVNQYLAEHYWPNEDPVGRSFRLQVGDDAVMVRVVGLAADVHVPLRAEKHPIIYRPWQQAPPVWVDVLVRSEMFSEELAEQVRQAIWSVDPNHFIQLYDSGDGPAIWFHRTHFAASLLSAFSGLAFLLSAGGVFAVVSFQIRRRRRELGIRKAVGARDRDLTSLLLSRTLRETAMGVALGVLASWAATRYVRELLYGVEPMDVMSILSAVFVILVAAILATYVPARRIRRIHPAEVLRSE